VPIIEIDEKTFRMLRNIKKESKASSYNQVIKSLILERIKNSCYTFGSNHKLRRSRKKMKLNSMNSDSCNEKFWDLDEVIIIKNKAIWC